MYGEITDIEFLRVVENLLNKEIISNEIESYIDLKYTAKSTINFTTEIIQEIDHDKIPVWFKDRAEWWFEI